jgi:hypothetical protein
VPSFRRQFARESVGAAQIIERKLIDTFREHYATLYADGDATTESKSMPSPDRFGPGFDLRCLSVMQHYEIPTRLLDWTANFWIAIYFACSSDPDADAELWYYDRNIFEPQLKLDFQLNSLLMPGLASQPEPELLSWTDRADLVEVDVQITPRMTQQLAHHTVSADVFADHAPLFGALPRDGADSSDGNGVLPAATGLSRLSIGSRCKPKALQFLAEHKDITASTIFPDVVGLGRFLRWQFDSLRTMML